MSEGLIRRPTAIYMQVADQLATAIKRPDSEYAPGSKLPSETELMARYGISRPTARAAVDELVNMGLIEKHHGRGSFVRDQTPPSGELPRSVTWSAKEKRYLVPELSQVEPPVVTRTNIVGELAAALERDEDDAEDAFHADHLLTTGSARVAHRVIIPIGVAAEVPALAAAPDAPIGEIYAHLAEIGPLWWDEWVSARTPLPDERSSLGLADASPLLITHRVTHGPDDRPLLYEELHAPAARVRLTYQIRPERKTTKPRTSRSSRAV
ncbi:GntR family transcriptional regulator [Streptomyces noursei]